MPEKVVEYMRPAGGSVYLDATAGEGGHVRAILQASAPDACVVCVDIDERALRAVQAGLKGFEKRIRLIRANYKDIGEIARQAGVDGFDGVVLDLGFSLSQINDAARGFSFDSDGPLDMRYDTSHGVTAYDVVNTFKPEMLEDIVRDFGEERRYKSVVRAIVHARERSRIEGTAALAKVIASAIGRHSRIHPATRTFQAIRIFVNNEMGNLKEFLETVKDFLNVGGVLVIISFHSLEDRIVKSAFRQLSASSVPSFQILTRKPVTPDEDEMRLNRRSRSAKLRAIKRVS
ncbi:MAG: 16S rRNA (cytosine(1402)-N(4))-methyltransferase RsmH [Deltaproteobacteria bacterium]|nr:16S rRNA (cytosine(1402)-N(4))-methyltransferase RsmH [Deltaproteobacteria bacterium]